MKPILYAEDEPDDIFFLQRAFRAAGIEAPLRTVPDGQSAINYLKGTGPYADRDRFPLPRLVLLDVNLPHVSGFDVLTWIRSTPSLALLPVVMLTSLGHQTDIRRATLLGVNGYLLKPSDPTQLTTVARALKAYWLTHDLMAEDTGRTLRSPAMPHCDAIAC